MSTRTLHDLGLAALAALTLTAGCGGDDGGASVDAARPQDSGPQPDGDPDAEGPDAMPGPTPTALVGYVGGGGNDTTRDVFVDAAGFVYATGGTASSDFATTTGAYDRTFGGAMDVWVRKWAPDGTLVFSTFVGGPGYDRAYAIEVAPTGEIYVAGRAGDGFPTTAGSFDSTFGGDVNVNPAYGTQDGFITKLSADGAAVAWSTFVGWNGREFIRDLALTPSGDVIAGVGEAWANTPCPFITSGAAQPGHGGGTRDVVIAAVAADGTTVRWATYLGGSAEEGGEVTVRTDAQGRVYVVTGTNSTDAPVTAGAFDPTFNGDFDLWLGRLAADGGSLDYGTYLGGSGGDGTETHQLSVEPGGVAVVTATTASSDMPVTAGVVQPSYGGSGGGGTGDLTNYFDDGYVARLSADGSTLLAATYLGGSVGEGLEGSGLDAGGNIWVSGGTFSPNFPTTAGARQRTKGAGLDAFVARLSPDLRTLHYATFVGASGWDVARSLAVRADGAIAYAGGETDSADLATTSSASQPNHGGQSDGLVVGIVP